MNVLDSDGDFIEESPIQSTHPQYQDVSVIWSYLRVKKLMIERGFFTEIDWQNNVNFESLSESDFLREYAWVVLSSGMRGSVVKGLFGSFSRAFYDWKVPNLTGQKVQTARRRALLVFHNERKVDAIVYVINIINDITFSVFKQFMATDPLTELRALPFIGPVTCFHLAKNIGVDIAKPDRHLSRLSMALGFNCVQELCNVISSVTGDKPSVVDVILWRYATITPDYLRKFVYLVESFNFDFSR